MSREIKFRAWDKHLGMVRHAGPKGLAVFFDKYENSPTLMQFTGLKDRHGVEIYEGDILAYYINGRTRPVKKYVAVWKQSKAGFNFSQKPIVMVVGNIYENPKLLATPNTKKEEIK